jgi:hypothetical protein
LKKFISCILILLVVFSTNFTIIAKEDIYSEYQYEKEVAISFLNSIGIEKKLVNPIMLYNLDGEEEVISYELDNGGYIIVNINDLSIPEFSLKGNRKFSEPNTKYVYNGPLAYFIENNNELVDIKTKAILSKDEFRTKYKKEKINKEAKFKADISKYSKVPMERIINAKKNLHITQLPKTLKTWYKSGGYCGPIASSILFMYYDKQFDDSYVSTSKESETLIDLMINYVTTSGGDPEDGTSYDELNDAINDYLDDYFSSNYSVIYKKPSYESATSKIKYCIANDKPAIVGLDNHATYGDHWVIAHGYVTSYAYIVVNDGWGENDVWIWSGLNANDNSVDGCIYLYFPL